MKKIITSDESPIGRGYKNVLDKSCKIDVQNFINTSDGRNYFISLLSKNTSNNIILKDKFFDILGELIYNTLIFLKPEEDNEEKIEQIIQLIKSTKYFEKEILNKEKTKGSKKNNERSVTTLWHVYGKNIRDIGYFNDSNFWTFCYNILLKKEEKTKEVETKKKVVMEICGLMIELDLNGGLIIGMCTYLADTFVNNNTKLLIDDIKKKLKAN